MAKTQHIRRGLNVPRHIAIIMDGNGRWAKQKGWPRSRGHLAGMQVLEKMPEWCVKRGIKHLTVYAFSTENWKRPKQEVDFLMSKFKEYVDKNLGKFIRNDVRITVVGRRDNVPTDMMERIDRAEKATARCKRFNLNIAFNYGGRDEIVRGIRNLYTKGKKAIDSLTEDNFRQYLDHPEIPDPDMIIRTGKEIRLSNFLLWSSSYSELYFTDIMWPEFNQRELDKSIRYFTKRSRRFGDIE